MADNGSRGNNLSPPSYQGLCKQGCGFYANSQFEGMCSKCYKDCLTRQQNKEEAVVREGQQQQVVRNAVAAAAAYNNSYPDSFKNTVSDTASSPLESGALPTVSSITASFSTDEASVFVNMGSSHEESSPDQENDDVDENLVSNTAEVAQLSVSSPSTVTKKRPRNRCAKCTKKVGLLGFECRCGEVFCSSHRYSDTHECSFDFQSHGQAQIRRANPRIEASKVNKI